MIQTHPQWLRVVELVRSGRIGQLRSAVGTFSYFKLDTDNIRNIRKYGGGALMDIGCYPIKCSRMVFGEEPTRVSASIVRGPRLDNIDMLTSAILDFPSGHCIFTCSTQIQLRRACVSLGPPMLQSGYITGYTKESFMSTTPQKRALKRYRKRLNQQGMARFEVLGLDADRELIRSLARRLAGDDPDSARIRATLRGTISGEQSKKGGILNALRRSPLVGADLNLNRPLTPGRRVDL